MSGRAPGSVYGSPEAMVDRGVSRGAREGAAMVRAFVDAVGGSTDSVAIRRALARTGKAFASRPPMLDLLEREILHSAMLGALDAGWEAEEERALEVPRLADVPIAKVRPSFASAELDAAIDAFMARSVLTRKAFDRLAADAKRRAFTVGALWSKRMVLTAHDELGKALRSGSGLTGFEGALGRRFKSAGWTTANPSHVETIFRTNVSSAYSAGRARQMSQDVVRRARPFWQVLTVNDGPPRQRETHRDVHGLVLPATSPVWKRAYPPFGFQCFLPGTEIQGRVVGGSRAVYRGKAVQLTTAEGSRLAVTAQHPVLTAHGFAAAGSLRQGDELVCYRSQPGTAPLRFRPEDHEHDHPTLAEDVFRALAEPGARIARHGSAVDFHGEAHFFDGEIEVVGSYRQLLDDAETAITEQSGEFILMQTATGEPLAVRLCAAQTRLQRATRAAAGIVGSAYLSPTLVGRHPGPLHELRLGPAAKLGASLGENAPHGLPADLSLIRELLHGGAGRIALDEITSVREFDFAGHVFDFETSTGWLVADGIVASNCRCRVRSLPATYDGPIASAADFSALPDPGFDTRSPVAL